MNKDELTAAVENGRDEFLAAVEGVPESALVEPGVVGDWSVKDILAHISRWEAELIGMLFQAERGLKPTTAQFSAQSADELNAKWSRESKNRPFERVWADFEGVHDQILRRLDALPEADLNNPKRWPWLEGRPLASYIAGDTFEHEQQHAAEVKKWRKARGL